MFGKGSYVCVFQLSENESKVEISIPAVGLNMAPGGDDPDVFLMAQQNPLENARFHG